MRSSLLCCAWTADDGDGATTQAAAAWHESKMHILSNTTGNVAIENFKKILIDDFCIPRDTTTIIPAIETWGNFLLTTDPSETRMIPFSRACLLLVALFCKMVVAVFFKKMQCQNCELSKNLMCKEYSEISNKRYVTLINFLKFLI